jgi:hypothetical protein
MAANVLNSPQAVQMSVFVVCFAIRPTPVAVFSPCDALTRTFQALEETH